MCLTLSCDIEPLKALRELESFTQQLFVEHLSWIFIAGKDWDTWQPGCLLLWNFLCKEIRLKTSDNYRQFMPKSLMDGTDGKREV